MIYKGLDDEEAGFLNFVVDQHASHFREMMNREKEELTAYRVYNNIYFSDISIYNIAFWVIPIHWTGLIHCKISMSPVSPHDIKDSLP